MTGQLVLCALVGPGAVVVPGSQKRQCLHCRAPVWLSPSSQAAERAAMGKGEPAWTPICMECAGRQVPPGGFKPEFLPGSYEELTATLGLMVGKRGRS